MAKAEACSLEMTQPAKPLCDEMHQPGLLAIKR